MKVVLAKNESRFGEVVLAKSQIRFGENVLANFRARVGKTKSRFGKVVSAKVVLAKSFWQKKSRFGEPKVVLANCLAESRFGEK